MSPEPLCRRHGLLPAALALAALAFAIPAPATDETSLEEQIAVCEGCHGGVDGVPVDAATPIIAGQEFYYLYVQLRDYAAGRRENPIMGAMVEGLDKERMQALAEHFATKAWPTVPSAVDDAKADAGESVLVAGQCSQCHSTYQGDSRIPRLAGQQLDYLKQTMLDFKSRARANDATKASLLSSFSEEDLTTAAHRLAGL